MNKSQLITRLTIPLVALGVFLSAYAYIPILRKLVGLDESFTMSFSTTLVFLIAGYMAALAGLISWSRTVDKSEITSNVGNNSGQRKPHLLGLSLLIPVPFISCILLICFWQKDKQLSGQLDLAYRKTINFHLSLHLYFLLCFFLAPIVIGFIILFLMLAIYLVATLICIAKGGATNYPINIDIVATK